MNKQFTASEVRTESCKQGQLHRQPASDMLNAFADRLEADEKAQPVAFRYQAQQVATGAWVWSGWLDLGDPGIASLHVHCKTADSTKIEYAYAYAPPSDTERLAEALQPFANLLQPHHTSMPDDRPIYGINKAEITAGDLRRANEAITAHSAQAQPPAASVTDAIARRMVAEYDAVLCGDPTATRTDGMRAALEAALAAQESPNGL